MPVFTSLMSALSSFDQRDAAQADLKDLTSEMEQAREMEQMAQDALMDLQTERKHHPVGVFGLCQVLLPSSSPASYSCKELLCALD